MNAIIKNTSLKEDYLYLAEKLLVLSSICLKQFNDDAAFALVGNAFHTPGTRNSLKLSRYC